MKYQITVPNVDDFDVVEISEILVAPGDTVNIDDSVVTLESEKAAMEIPSPKSGTVSEIHTKVGDKVQSDTLLVTLEIVETEQPAEQSTPTKTDTPTPKQTQSADEKEIAKQQPLKPAAEKDTDSFHASPSVRRFARELGVKLSAVSGSGPKGRITRADVAQYFRTLASATAQPSAKHVDYRRFGNTRTEKVNRIQRASARHLQSAWQTIPHVTQHDDADISKLEDHRKQLNEAKDRTVKLNLLPFLIKALAFALKEHPRFNASMEDKETLLLRDYYHVGVAVDTENGLLVPVIRDVDKKNIATIADEVLQLAEQAREGKLNTEAMSGGCITISNLGGFDSGAFAPIINAPEAAILGVSRSRITPIWDGKQFVPKYMLPLHLSYDHRLNNGVAAVRFLSYYKELLSKPEVFK